MKKNNAFLLFAVIALLVTGCELIGTIFNAGVYTGIFLVVFVLVIIVIIIARISKR